jgi:hypothetical protein
MWDNRAQYVDNHDGDNATMILDYGRSLHQQLEIRLANVWAPELSDPGGLEVQVFVRRWFLRHSKLRWPFIVWSHRMKEADKEQMTFNRYVGTITTADGKRTLNTEVMAFIVANGYTGGIGSIVRK